MKRIIQNLFVDPPPVLRAATIEDAAALAEIHGAAFRRGWDFDEFERLLRDRAVRAHVVSEGARTAPSGFVLSHVVVPEAEILSIAVKADRRGRRLGHALLQHHLARLASEGVITSFLEVDEANAAALALYGRLGYEQAGRRKGYYAGGSADALVLRRDF
jgi:ribosomal-protein-alanine N-acetyltransferase